MEDWSDDQFRDYLIRRSVRGGRPRGGQERRETLLFNSQVACVQPRAKQAVQLDPAPRVLKALVVSTV